MKTKTKKTATESYHLRELKMHELQTRMHVLQNHVFHLHTYAALYSFCLWGRMGMRNGNRG